MNSMPTEYEKRKIIIRPKVAHLAIVCRKTNYVYLYSAIKQPISSIVMLRIGSVFRRIARRPFESTIYSAMIVPSIRTKLRGKDKTTAAVSGSTSDV